MINELTNTFAFKSCLKSGELEKKYNYLRGVIEKSLRTAGGLGLRVKVRSREKDDTLIQAYCPCHMAKTTNKVHVMAIAPAVFLLLMAK